MSSRINRETLRERARRWSDVERRILIERVVELMPDMALNQLFGGLVRQDELQTENDAALPLNDRIAAHVAATRRGDFLGDCVLRNRHGEREPWQTRAWVAATSHLFDIALECVRLDPTEDALANLRSLADLVEEVDSRPEELVVFEDYNARDRFYHDLRIARSLPASSIAP